MVPAGSGFDWYVRLLSKQGAPSKRGATAVILVSRARKCITLPTPRFECWTHKVPVKPRTAIEPPFPLAKNPLISIMAGVRVI